MKLLIDVGNSRIKWAFQIGSELRDTGSCEHRGRSRAAVAQFLAGLAHAPATAFAVNVAGSDLASQLAAVIHQRFAIDLQTVVPTPSCGSLRNGYAHAAQLGADRWAAMVGAWCGVSPAAAGGGRQDLLVVDAGTAVTLDVIRADGQHLGGLIVPGIALMQSALGHGTSDLARLVGEPALRVSAASAWLGDNTGVAIERGALTALCGLIERVLRSRAAHLLLTGGDAELLAAHLGVAAELRPLLVLEGLDYLTASAG